MKRKGEEKRRKLRKGEERRERKTEKTR